ncbi:hypothetical protein VNO77_06427 [Canavalia gladiata]|uniref:Ribosomal eL28/Mak16 domain-containing protein n=1 Tax=Canavalia gladiata TaxID=3824 RepID=A0AAN9QVA0_CANGL
MFRRLNNYILYSHAGLGLHNLFQTHLNESYKAKKKVKCNCENIWINHHFILLCLYGTFLKQNPSCELLVKAKMATVPGQLVWEIVKKNNSFLVKQFGRGTQSVEFSRETNNLYNLNSFKYSGLANKKTVTVQPVGKDLSVLFATTKTKKQNKPAALLHKSVMKKEFRRMAKAVVNQVADNNYRPDLKKAALARLSAVHRSLKVAKSGVKKRNRQAVKVAGRK